MAPWRSCLVRRLGAADRGYHLSSHRPAHPLRKIIQARSIEKDITLSLFLEDRMVNVRRLSLRNTRVTPTLIFGIVVLTLIVLIGILGPMLINPRWLAWRSQAKSTTIGTKLLWHRFSRAGCVYHPDHGHPSHPEGGSGRWVDQRGTRPRTGPDGGFLQGLAGRRHPYLLRRADGSAFAGLYDLVVARMKSTKYHARGSHRRLLDLVRHGTWYPRPGTHHPRALLHRRGARQRRVRSGGSVPRGDAQPAALMMASFIGAVTMGIFTVMSLEVLGLGNNVIPTWV